MHHVSKKTLLFVCGTRPEVIKLAPVIHAAEADDAVRAEICLTAQHRQLTDQFLPFFGLRPCVDLNLMSANQSLAELTSQVVSRCSAVYEKSRPDLVVVQGDTATAFAAALAASLHQIPVAHVEAGLRSHCRHSPFPEETNRVLISHIAQLHFAPTPAARDNLYREGVRRDVFVVGNTVVDALQLGLRALARTDPPAALAGWDDMAPRPLVLVTLHRRESWGEPLQNVCRALAETARDYPTVEFVYPIHPNPLVREPARRLLTGLANVRLLDPLGYQEFLWLLARSALVLTDSGGVVEEAATLGIPTLVAREETERAEAINAGAAILVGANRQRITVALRPRLDAALRDGPVAPRDGKNPRPVFGDGHAAARILYYTKRYLGLGKPGPDPVQKSTVVRSHHGKPSCQDLLFSV